ncbi:MAG: gamma-glutamyl-gamma-aminobutyrate hydrolase family protein [Zetaproteobacteria bacterium]|nr:gamma-glutamyl-gamma-aminobutyrate hydrolase family protein [Zetaproteobacteria bacterium]
MAAPLRIGVSACMWSGDPHKVMFNGRPLIYMEASMARYLMRQNCAVYMIPPPAVTGTSVTDLVDGLDGLVLHGGVDVAPESYGERALQSQWAGDGVRDRYERELIHACYRQGKPIFGICRGLQMINIAFGGTLYQDIGFFCPDALVHRDAQLYEKNEHSIEMVAGSRLSLLYSGQTQARVNSVHHQAVKDLAKGFVVEARSTVDGVVEAIRRTVTHEQDPFVFGVQWHPEFQSSENTALLNPDVLLAHFVEAMRQRKP